MGLGSLIYSPIYFTFGALVSPFVIPYHTNFSLGLAIPSFNVILPLEIVRGFLYVLALLPLLAILKIRNRYPYFRVVTLLYVLGTLIPFLLSPLEILPSPVPLRIFHGLEILADSFVYGAAIVTLLSRKV